MPILLEWLPRIDDASVKEAIVRNLSTKCAKPVAGRPLLEEFVRTSNQREGLKWAIGSALDVVADDALVPSLSALARDKRHGRAREMIVLRLGRAPKRRKTVELLTALLGRRGRCTARHVGPSSAARAGGSSTAYQRPGRAPVGARPDKRAPAAPTDRSGAREEDDDDVATDLRSMIAAHERHAEETAAAR